MCSTTGHRQFPQPYVLLPITSVRCSGAASVLCVYVTDGRFLDFAVANTCLSSEQVTSALTLLLGFLWDAGQGLCCAAHT